MRDFKIIGVNSKKVYAKGDSRADCLRKLSEEYPTLLHDSSGRNKIKGRTKSRLFPEALMIIRRGVH